MQVTEKITITNEDNMELMKRYPDNYFDLAIVDPPYGIGNALVDGGGTRKAKFDNNRDSIKWDVLPSKEYFNELFRVSKNQIVWGGNYFDLPPTRCNLIWDKMQSFSGSDFELAWTSFDKASKAFRMSRVEAYCGGKMHPTQKPVDLYKWILEKYAIKEKCIECGGSGYIEENSRLIDCYPCEMCNNEGVKPFKILDTHLGGGSIAIACHDYDFELTACELDKEYYDKAIQRIKNHVSQQKLDF